MATADVDTPVPSHMRTVPGSVNIHVAQFPRSKNSSNNSSSSSNNKTPASAIDPEKVASAFLDTFNQALDKNDFTTLSTLFVENGYWRDHLAVTWAFRTVRTPAGILDFVQSSAKSRDGFRLKKLSVDDSGAAARAPKVAPVDAAGEVPGVQFFVALETALGSGTGLVKLVQEEEGGEWRIFTLYTRLEQLRGHEEATYERRGQGVQHGGRPGRKNWAERREADANFESTEPAVFVVGTRRLP